MHVILLHPKKAILPTFFGQTPHFISEKQKHGINNLYHWKSGSVAVMLSLRVGVQHIKKWRNNFSTRGSQIYTVSCKASYTK